MNYWERKEEMIQKAHEHDKYVRANFADEIKDCIDRSEIILEDREKDALERINDKEPLSTLEAEFQLSTIQDYIEKSKPIKNGVVLNFASYKHPGGAFLAGSTAQEECLCHASILYPILTHFEEFYSKNRKELNNGLYYTRMIYTPDVIFFRGKKDPIKLDVVTCAAPNAGAAERKGVSEDKIRIAMQSRIITILDVIEKHRKDKILLGAYGCGVFANSPQDVGRIFGNEIQFYEGNYIFVIPDMKTHKPFNHGVMSSIGDRVQCIFGDNPADFNITKVGIF